MTIIKGTTPTISFSYSDIDVSNITVAVLTIKQNNLTKIERTLETATVGEKMVSWTLSQAETLSLADMHCVICCDWKLASGVRGRSNVLTANVEESGKNEVI